MIEEQKQKAVVLSFGRLNPITSGHAKLVDKIKSVAKDEGAQPHLYLSHSQDKAKNPLEYDEKYKYARQAFGAVVKKSRSRTIIEVLKELDKKFDRVIIVVGSDRIREFESLLNRYNGREYNYDSIEVVSAGERDPDAEGVTGMSASKMRALAAQGDYDSFVKGLPKKLQSKRTAQEIFDTIRERMGITEEMSLTEAVDLHEVLTLQQRRKRKLTMRRIKNKIKRGRRIAQRKLATPEKLKTRAQRKAKEQVRKRLAGKRGVNYKSLSMSQRIQIDKQVSKRKNLIQKLAKRLLPQVRKAERERLKKFRQRKASNEEINLIAQLSPIIESVERHKLSENIQHNLAKKSERYGIPIEELKQAYLQCKETYQNENETFQSLNSLLANRSKAVLEAIEYHSDHDIPLYENVFRMYSDNYFQFFRETRKLYTKGMLTLDAVEEELINTDIGEFAVYEENGRRERVPLDCPMVYDELDELNVPRSEMPQIDEKDLKGKYELKKETIKIESLKTSQDERVPGLVEKTKKKIESGKYKKPLLVDKNNQIVNGHHRYDAYLALNEKNVPVVKVLNATVAELKDKFSHTTEESLQEAEYDGRDVELNEPKRGGSKKFYVYVKDGDKVKKVEFGDTTGLKVKLDDKEAAKSFAARHKCSQKKDKTKAGYWSCRLPRYAKQLGLSGGGSHFW